MRTKLKASAKRTFTIRLMWLIGLGYHKTFFQIDKYNVIEQVDFYILCFRIQAIQYFKKADNEN